MIFLGMLLVLLAGCPHPVAVDPTAVAVREVDARAREVLESAAGSLEVDERRRALSALILVDPGGGGGAWGPRGRWDPDPYVVGGVVEALGRRADPESFALLEALARDTGRDPYLRGRAALVLAHADPARWRAPLAELAAAQHREAEMILLAAAVAGDAPALERLKTRLERGDLPMDLALPRAIARSGLPLGPALAAAVAAVEPEMQPALAAAWGAIDPVAARPWFVDALGGDDEERAIEAAEWLVELGIPAPASSRSEVAAALLALGSGPVSAAVEAAADPDPDVRAAAARALGRHLQADPRGGGAARRELERLATTPHPLVQIPAIEALGRAGGSEAVLRSLLGDESARVRVTAAAALVGA